MARVTFNQEGLYFGLGLYRAGPGPRGTMGTLAQFMGTSAATFG